MPNMATGEFKEQATNWSTVFRLAAVQPGIEAADRREFESPVSAAVSIGHAPELIGRVLGIIYRMIAGHLIRQTGHTQQSARTVAVTLIQRFGFKPRFPWVR